MAKRAKGWTRAQKVATAVTLAVILALSFFISYGRELGLDTGLPGWGRIHAWLGLDDGLSSAGDYELSVHFINVGQGDSTLILNGPHAVLIDGGEREQGEVVLQYLYDLGVEKLDCVVATHPHSDHIGGLVGVLKVMPTDNVLLPRLTESNTPTTRVYADLLDAIAESGAKVWAAVAGDEYSYGDIRYTVLAPLAQDENLNNMSVVLRLVYENTALLFTGDAEAAAEQRLLDSGAALAADLLKVGHHGSNTSSSKAFLEAVGPSWAVLSCGAGNSYGHPHEEVMRRFASLGAEVYRTDRSGTIVCGVDGEGKLDIRY